MRQVVGFLRVLLFPPQKKGPQRYSWNIVESGIKHHDPDHNRMFDAFQFFAMNVPDESFPETSHAY